MISMDLWLHHGQKVKIKSENYKCRAGTIKQYLWNVGNYLITMDNGHVLPFHHSEFEVVEGEE